MCKEVIPSGIIIVMRYQTVKFNYGDEPVYVVFDSAFDIEIGAFKTAREAQTFRQLRTSQDKVHAF